ncbi:prepilin-type N-terminal cleavage/methylation domain-containing protein [Dyella sp. 7MK23]|uniref:Prepilin-type N-terminal cleavage/methylation domain-containing protein n=2 Tax=Dyella acidiphila TaxID=2775866 RepID=A0ABR9G7P8_9GAMM|nr:prepilin-type N-terminal cleavage/methylation domain-containing protein [Dyella acidiphila]
MSLSSLRQRLNARGALGFTLIELMVVVAIVAILAAIAMPIYQQQVQRSRRTAAKTALLDVASREEKYYSTNNNYTTSFGSLGYSGAPTTLSIPGNGQNFYTVQFPASASTSGTSFSIQAVPVSTGPQASDACGTYTLTDLGVQGNSGNSQTSGCW